MLKVPRAVLTVLIEAEWLATCCGFRRTPQEKSGVSTVHNFVNNGHMKLIIPFGLSLSTNFELKHRSRGKK